MKILLSFSFTLISIVLFSQDDFDLARKHFSENNIDSARFYINKSLRRNPQPDDYFLSGLIHESENKSLRALADYEAVVKAQPTNLEAYFQKGLIYYNSASAEQAIKDFTYVIENHKNSNTNAIYFANDPYGKKATFVTSLQSMVGSVYQYRGMAYQKLGNDSKALLDFNKSFEYDTLPDFYINRSQLFTKMNKEALAIQDLEQALKLDPTNYVAWYNLALLDESALLPTYLLDDEEFSPMLNLLGANAYETGEYSLATKYLTKAIENNPEDELAYINRGKALMKTKSYRQARADFLKALQINANNIEVFYLIGNSFFYEENFEDAIGFYERYLSVDQSYQNVWYNAAMAYLSTKGHLAAGVPGSVDGMFKLHEKFGSMPMANLIQPAINLAYYGYVLTEDAAFQINEKRSDLETVNGSDFFLVKEGGWKAGDSVRYEELAGTLTQIRDRGRAGFYDGIVADQIAKEMQRGGGLITKEDLLNYSAKWREPITGNYRGNKVISMPPPSSGGVAVLQLLQGADQYDISSLGHNTKETIHILTELERRVYADRATHLGDPDFYDVPVDMLLDDDYNKRRFATIKLNEKTDSQEIKEGKVDVIESVETTHFSVVDSDGNAVAITTTLNSFFGCKVFVRGAGFFLNNEMDDFSSKPGVPNQFGLVGGEANAIIPEKRMLSSMTPTIIEKDGSLKMVVGTPGGSTIITSVFQTIMNVIDHGMTMQDAVNARRTHSQWLPDRILVEKNGLEESVVNGLEKMGHKIEFRESMGRMDCILVREDGKLEGGADYSRGDNYAEGF